jgi:hypothetical protein
MDIRGLQIEIALIEPHGGLDSDVHAVHYRSFLCGAFRCLIQDGNELLIPAERFLFSASATTTRG